MGHLLSFSTPTLRSFPLGAIGVSSWEASTPERSECVRAWWPNFFYLQLPFFCTLTVTLYPSPTRHSLT
jgi:hypothetical protein